MRRTTTGATPALLLQLGVAVLMLGLLPAGALANDDDQGMDMGHGHGHTGGHHHEGGDGDREMLQPDSNSVDMPTYFRHPEHQLTLYAHVVLMVLAWVVALPVAVMFSLARSPWHTMASQLVFLTTNAAGLLAGIVYNHGTPDLYPGNAHHTLGWFVSWLVLAQVVVGILARIAGHLGTSSHRKPVSFIPVPTEAAMSRCQVGYTPSRLSNDSGQGTERNTASLRSFTSSESGVDEEAALKEQQCLRDEDSDVEFDRFLGGSDDGGDVQSVLDGHARGSRAVEVARKAAGLIKSAWAWKALTFGYSLVDRTILILGFAALLTGGAALGRLFEGAAVLGGLAHWIKGGVFFWLGVFSLGRWCGAFAEFGWAWNLRPMAAAAPGRTETQRWRPSAEFAESFLLFVYGASNVWLEHLGKEGESWSSQDLEHLAIAALFLGGGLCGMLVDSTWIRDLLNASSHGNHPDNEAQKQAPPEQYSFSLNPVPALILVLLGFIISSHIEAYQLTGIIHKHWGQLLTGAALARILTYVLVWLRPPRSTLPSRPPTELLAAFGLMAGGVEFMASSGDTTQGLFNLDINAMLFFTVNTGLVAVLMAWVVALMALKGWAVGRRARAAAAVRC